MRTTRLHDPKTGKTTELKPNVVEPKRPAPKAKKTDK